jgi:hypothetical protein
MARAGSGVRSPVEVGALGWWERRSVLPAQAGRGGEPAGEVALEPGQVVAASWSSCNRPGSAWPWRYCSTPPWSARSWSPRPCACSAGATGTCPARLAGSPSSASRVPLQSQPRSRPSQSPSHRRCRSNAPAAWSTSAREQTGQEGDGQQPTASPTSDSRSPAAASRPGHPGSGPSSTPRPTPAGSAAKTSNPTTPATRTKVESYPARRGQAAAWKRIRAWSASQATRSGPSTAGSWRSMLGRRRAARTGTPSLTTLPLGTWRRGRPRSAPRPCPGQAGPRRPGRPRTPPLVGSG